IAFEHAMVQRETYTAVYGSLNRDFTFRIHKRAVRPVQMRHRKAEPHLAAVDQHARAKVKIRLPLKFHVRRWWRQMIAVLREVELLIKDQLIEINGPRSNTEIHTRRQDHSF